MTIKRNLVKTLQSIRYQATTATAHAESTLNPLPNAAIPPKYALVTVRSFPSLEPLTFVPVPTSTVAAPLRRDILWRAVVYENDNRRVGASNPPGRSENGFSRRKLMPQKGSGRARVGDANSPTRHNGGRALARTAPNDYTTELPSKVYSMAFNNALSHQYKSGKLFVIGGEKVDLISPTPELDLNRLDLVNTDTVEGKEVFEGEVIFRKFLEEFQLKGKRLLFITDKTREGLIKSSDPYKQKVDVIQKELVEVNDILRAQAVFIELEALEYLAMAHQKEILHSVSN
ncbi:BAG_1a_G0039580.mRNA.1.CDS.1 [Saccharomyces cerevisiae]|nr:SX2_G0022610.mRNA.1.CDS.1 [Saccharomyces cerevisiae]CAI4648691.1 BAG_1a_G0039580.mRNA.1.CDS.1 [Saccharomyces cerevisiae]CAI7240053.1 BAG_1a_G0039580.mRNA.1.CDS.1 [Saccharomyces cerevisiae]